MIVIAGTSPINYLVIIEQIEVLPKLYGRILIPPSVCEELQRARTPEIVRLLSPKMYFIVLKSKPKKSGRIRTFNVASVFGSE